MKRKPSKQSPEATFTAAFSDSFLVRCTPEQKRSWMEHARRKGLGLAAWVRMTLLRAQEEEEP